jgi:hypothetical protein
MHPYLPQMIRYQREVFDLSQAISRSLKCLGELPPETTMRQTRQQARLVLSALREHQEGVQARFAELETLLAGEEK